MYLDFEDLCHGAYEETLNTLRRYEPNSAIAIADAMALVKSYLFRLYDIDSEYLKTSSLRCPFLVKIIRDIAIYNIYCIASPSQMSDTRRLQYEDAIRYLERVQAQKAFIPDLEPLSDDRKDFGGSYAIYHGTNPRRNNQY